MDPGAWTLHTAFNIPGASTGALNGTIRVTLGWCIVEAKAMLKEKKK